MSEYSYEIDKYIVGVDSNGEDGIGLTIATMKDNELHILGSCYGDNARFIDLLIKENQELKKQLKEWENHLKCSKEMLDIQGQKGNYDYDEYMLGLYNGMEYIIALFETREPNYISGKDVKFTNNKTQQKEFIKWLEDDLKEKYRDMGYRHNIFREILQKYKEIIGVSDENNMGKSK